MIKCESIVSAIVGTMVSVNVLAETCNANTCSGYEIPMSARRFISSGYSEVKIKSLLKDKFLFLGANGVVNKCYVLFGIENNKINNFPSIGQEGNFCNISNTDDRIISTWREQGVWNSNVYKVDATGKWVLLINDKCSDCLEVKRRYFNNGVPVRKSILSGGDDYLSRKQLVGNVLKEKVFLYTNPSENQKSKAYLVKNDSFNLIDMSDDGFYYQIEYKALSGKISLYWIKANDFKIKK